ncbi:MAG: UDP-N-acetylmuramate--L-alanine ligase [Verrucomicrobia bacterium]|nr:UDP-N-acetylmuramate--L-alanine ligase [Verrucomicrobiota bacterium]
MKHYHFIGIGGIGMSALARILLDRGVKVQGSDLSRSALVMDLEKEGATIFSEHKQEFLGSAEAVVYSTDVKVSNPEFASAKEKQLPLLHRSELLAQLMQGSKSLLVAGTHGKTTTTSLLAHVLCHAGLDPSFAVGGIVQSLGTNGRHGNGAYFVAEADESDGSFLSYDPFAAIVTNIDLDHLDHWKTEETLIEGFQKFIQKVSSQLVWCADDERLFSLNPPGISYGFSEDADAQIVNFTQKGWSISYDLVINGKTYPSIEVPLLGEHNAKNSAAVFTLALHLGLSQEVIRSAFATFLGAKRRMEFKGEKRGVQIYDDYGHHPTEIATTVQGLRAAIGEKRLIVAFQPHRYTRTRDLFHEFSSVFDHADLVILTDIYSAREEPIPGITGESFFQEVSSKSRAQCLFFSYATLPDRLAELLRPHDVLLTIGAGNITSIGPQVLTKEIAPLKMAFIVGGRSPEHDVSYLSAKVIQPQISSELYQTTTLEISKEGNWHRGGSALPLSEVISELQTCDVIFPMLHGIYCEDGMLQGFFQTLGVPYTGPDYRSAPVAMDKAWTKHIAANRGIAVADFLEFTALQWQKNKAAVLSQITDKFSFPFFVKPVHLGSTFGVFRVTDLPSLESALDQICRIDYKFLAEAEVIGRELEIGLLGNDDLLVSDPAEVVKTEAIYTYEGKYGTSASPALVKVPLPPTVREEGKRIAEVIYRAIGCTGFARIDFFLTEDNRWILNEVNPIPGCTPTSVYPKILAGEGVPVSQLVDRLVIAALHRHRLEQKL